MTQRQREAQRNQESERERRVRQPFDVYILRGNGERASPRAYALFRFLKTCRLGGICSLVGLSSPCWVVESPFIQHTTLRKTAYKPPSRSSSTL